MTYNEDLIAEAESFTAGAGAAGLIARLAEALSVKETWYADSHALAIENSILEDRVASLEAAAQSHHFAAGSL